MIQLNDEYLLLLNGIAIWYNDRFSFSIKNEELIIKYVYTRPTSGLIVTYFLLNIFIAVCYHYVPVNNIFYCMFAIIMNTLLYYYDKKKTSEKKEIISSFNFLNHKIYLKKYRLEINFSDVEKLVYCKNFNDGSEYPIQIFTLFYNKKNYLLAFMQEDKELIPENILIKLKEKFSVRELDYCTKIEVDF